MTVVFTITSCSEWLNITPKGQVDAGELLTDVKGYNAAINGVYSIMSSTSLYGKNMTYGIMDVYAQYWKLTPVNDFGKAYAYDKETLKSNSEGLWKSMYQCIAQCNQILEAYSKTGTTIENSTLFKGEALGLRGFLHLELLKMFGPVLKTEADYGKVAIPYRKAYDNVAIKFNSVKEVLDMARADLLAAIIEMQDDPINENGRDGNGNRSQLDYSSVLDRRGNRMNLWAAKATLARLEMLAGNKSKALEYCQEIIEKATIFIFNPDLNHIQEIKRDLICSSELIFSLYGNDYFKNTANTFGFNEVAKNSERHLLISKDNFVYVINNIYGRTPDGSGADFRLKYWFAQVVGEYQDLAKLRAAKTGSGLNPPYLPEISLIKLPEIYYMAAECLIGIDNAKAMSYINRVRFNRGLTEMEGSFSDDEVARNIFREYKKEFIGDGILFGYYKRLNKDIETLDGNVIPATNDIFVFQIPDDEYEFSPNEK